MELFRADGHLTDEALTALIREEPLGELERLEMAEHLAFCDWCLQRYTGALEGAALRTPQRSCRETLWRRIRTRTWQLITSRYATAAAAVALALTLVWSGERIHPPAAAGGAVCRCGAFAGVAGAVGPLPGPHDAPGGGPAGSHTAV